MEENNFNLIPMETNELTKPDSFIETELQRFEKIITKEQLITLADSVKDLVIKDTEDKAGLKAVIEGRKQLKAQRVAIQKEAKNIRESAVRFQKAIIAKEHEFVALLEPTELTLEDREANYYIERERIKKEEEKRESDRIQAMIDQLGAVRHAVDFHELKALTEVQFQNILSEATIKYQADLKAEEEDRQRQYELRLQEETRLQQAQKEQEERERKFEEEQSKFRAEKERQEKELFAKQKQLVEQQKEIDRQDQERREVAQKEQLAKEEEARKKQEEIDRKKHAREAKEQALLFGEDADRFDHIAKILNDLLIDQIWANMKSMKGKSVGVELRVRLRIAHDLCKQNTSDKVAD